MLRITRQAFETQAVYTDLVMRFGEADVQAAVTFGQTRLEPTMETAAAVLRAVQRAYLMGVPPWYVKLPLMDRFWLLKLRPTLVGKSCGEAREVWGRLTDTQHTEWVAAWRDSLAGY